MIENFGEPPLQNYSNFTGRMVDKNDLKYNVADNGLSATFIQIYYLICQYAAPYRAVAMNVKRMALDFSEKLEEFNTSFSF